MPVTGDEDVRVTIVVVVTHRYTHPVIAIAGIGQTSFLGHVGESAVGILSVETIPVLRIGAVEISRIWASRR